MDKETAAALEASIAKWERNAEASQLSVALIRPEGCPLCLLFNPSGQLPASADCIGCPVRDRTGQKYCAGTPYDEAFTEWEHGKLRSFRKAAQREADFLRSLLPKATSP